MRKAKLNISCSIPQFEITKGEEVVVLYKVEKPFKYDKVNDGYVVFLPRLGEATIVGESLVDFGTKIPVLKLED